MGSEGLKLSVYFGESDRVGRDLLSDVLMDRLADAEILASTILRGVEGFGIKHQLRTDRILSLSEDLPLVIVCVDRADRVKRLVPEILPLIEGGLVTLERVVLPGLQLDDDLVPANGGDDAKVTVYCGRGEERRGRQVVPAVLELLKSAGLPGATAFLGLDGTILAERRRGRFFSRNEGVPAMVVSVGPRRTIAELLPRLRALSARHVTTLERVHVVRRAGRVLGDLPASATHDESGLGIWQRVMVFCGEQARWEGGPLHTHLIRGLREAGAAGATVLRGVVGYSDDMEVHGDRLLSVRRNTPVVVTMIDSVEEIARLWPIVARATASTGLVTCEAVPAFHALGPDGEGVGGLKLARPT